MNKRKKSKEEFKVMEWIRKVRDKNYEKYKDLNPKDYVELMNKEAKKFEQKKLSTKVKSD